MILPIRRWRYTLTSFHNNHYTVLIVTWTASLSAMIAVASTAQAQQPQNQQPDKHTPATHEPSPGQPVEESSLPSGAEEHNAEENNDDQLDTPIEYGREVIFLQGSALRRRASQTVPTPSTVLERDDLDAVGRASLGDILQRRLVSNVHGSNTQGSDGDGSTRVSLRGLGASRTLVLLNGRRFVAGGNGANSSVDFNGIPNGIIERVELLPDASSSIYGSSAMGGMFNSTINLVTRSGFTGSEASAAVHTSQDGLGAIYNLSLMTGYNATKGSFLFAADYHRQHSMGANERDFGRYNYRYDWDKRQEIVVGNTATPNGTIIIRDDSPGNAAWDRLLENCTSGACILDSSTGTWRDFNSNGINDPNLSLEQQGDYYNYQSEHYLLAPSQRYHIFASGDYRFTRRIHAFYEALYSNRQSEQQRSSEALYTASEGIAISADNIYNPFGRDIHDLRRQLIEFGNRRFTQDIDTYRLVWGFEGDVGKDAPFFADWHWELSANFGRTRASELDEGRINRVRLIQALGPSYIDTDGTPRCGTSDQSMDPKCVPLDVFSGYNDEEPSITAEMIDWLSYRGVSLGESTQRIVEAFAGGKVVDLPYRGEIRMSVGGQHRREAGSIRPNPLEVAGDTSGRKTTPIGGGFQVNSGSLELAAIPLRLRSFPQELELAAAVGGFDYNNSVGRLRRNQLSGRLYLGAGISLFAQRAQSFREPSIRELHKEQRTDFPSVSDPCDTSNGPLSGMRAQQCAAQGVPNDHVDPRTQTQLKTITGDNTILQTESARLWNAAIEYRPLMLSGPYVSARYFHAKIIPTMWGGGAATILSNCYDRGIQESCDLITRDTMGLITEIDDRPNSAGSLTVAGIETNIRYDLDTLNVGSFRFDIASTWLQKVNLRTPDNQLFKGAGYYDLGHFPKWRGHFSSIWNLYPWSAGANIYYTGSILECVDDNCNVELNRETDDTTPEARRRVRDVGAHVTADLWAAFTYGHGPTSLKVTLGVNNLRNLPPPKIYNGLTATTEPTAYELGGRQFYARVSQSF